jgi:long-chain fatty acid transport protein
MRIHSLTTALVAALFCTQVFASGYEKSIVWGGRSAGLAGIATPYSEGANSLYFNPAGLVAEKQGHDIFFNVSPTESKFQGPINSSNDQLTSESKTLYPLSLMYGNTLNEKMGFGVGFYVSGGSYANYEDIPYSSPTATPHVKTDLKVYELAAGYAYRVNEKLKLGLAWRVVMAEADFAFVQRGTGTLANIEVNDMKDTNYTGFKLGAQYKISDATKLGFTYRSEVELEADGKFGGKIYNPGPALNIDANDAKAKTTFPMAATLGVQHDLNENWRLFGEYAWTQYSAVDKITVEGTLSHSGGTVVATNPEIIQKWKDQHNVRLASEYLGWGMPFRFGYGWTSQVTNDDYARAAFTAPGDAHTLTVGSGRTFNENLQLDGGLEYTWIEGEGNGAAAGTTGAGTDIRQGDYTTSNWAVHLSLGYNF